MSFVKLLVVVQLFMLLLVLPMRMFALETCRRDTIETPKTQEVTQTKGVPPDNQGEKATTGNTVSYAIIIAILSSLIVISSLYFLLRKITKEQIKEQLDNFNFLLSDALKRHKSEEKVGDNKSGELLAKISEVQTSIARGTEDLRRLLEQMPGLVAEKLPRQELTGLETYLELIMEKLDVLQDLSSKIDNLAITLPKAPRPEEHFQPRPIPNLPKETVETSESVINWLLAEFENWRNSGMKADVFYREKKYSEGTMIAVAPAYNLEPFANRGDLRLYDKDEYFTVSREPGDRSGLVSRVESPLILLKRLNGSPERKTQGKYTKTIKSI